MDDAVRQGCICSELTEHGVQAVSEADAVTSPKHPRTVPLLVPLGIVFARTQRITYAEGIFRCVARGCHL